MLVLTRRIGQTIRIGDDITVMAVKAQQSPEGVKVRIGIEAPADLIVTRPELDMPMRSVGEDEARLRALLQEMRDVTIRMRRMQLAGQGTASADLKDFHRLLTRISREVGAIPA